MCDNYRTSESSTPVSYAARDSTNGEPQADIPTLNIGDSSQVNIEELKRKMKYQFRQEGPVAVQSVGTVLPVAGIPGWPKTIIGNELSSSLPNLTIGNDNDFLKQVTGSHVRNSLSDIWNKQERISGQVPGHQTDIIQEQILLKTLSLEDCPSCGQEESLLLVEPDVKGTCPKHQNNPSAELTVNVGPNNNRLSAVLENIPLLYIPHTKQLISVGCNGSATDSLNKEAQDSRKKEILKSQNQMDSTSAPLSMQETSDPSNINLPSIEHSNTKDSSLPVASKLPGVSISHQPAQPTITIDPENDNSSLNNQTNCNNLSVSSVMAVSSQESDALDRSEQTGTGFLEVDTYSQGQHNQSSDFEEEIADELTKINVDRDSPKSASLPRTNTMGSLSKTDASSYSSISSISTGTEFSNSAASFCDDYVDVKSQDPTPAEDGGFVEINLHARNSYERSSRNSSQDSGIDEKQAPPLPSLPTSGMGGAKQKRRGITSFLARSLFSRKAKDSTDLEQGALGWKLFGKVQPKQIPQKDPSEISKEYKNKVQSLAPTVTTPPLPCRMKKTDVEAPSTTALILEQRPHGLPSKSPEEELRHKQEYEAMVEAAKKREMKDAKQRKKQLQQQLKHEEALSAAVRVWNTEILPNWETMHNSKKSRDLWWSGCPPSVRGKVWKLAIGNDLNLTPELYEICLVRAKDRLKIMRELAESDTDSLSSFTESSVNKEASVDLIKLDVSRTFPQLCIFQKGGPYHELLQGLLGAYACYRPDVGYVQGMSFIAAVLLLNMDVDDAFICFANLLNQPCQIAFFRLDETLMKSYFDTYEEFFKENLPKLYAHFQKQSLTPDLYIIDWMFTLYAKSLPLDVASRVWDVFARDGEEFLFRTALGILKLYEDILLNMDFIHLAQFLTRLPEHISDIELFRNIDRIYMTIDNKRFNQVLMSHREPKDT